MPWAWTEATSNKERSDRNGNGEGHKSSNGSHAEDSTNRRRAPDEDEFL